MLRKWKWVLKLGLLNLVRVGCYRIALKAGVFKIVNPINQPITENFISVSNNVDISEIPEISWFAFGCIKQSFITPPNWHQSVITQKQHPQQEKHWSDISEINHEIGDIKGIWENSRWDWLWLLASQHEVLGVSKEQARHIANIWLLDWSKNNPANKGPNWKCGQEASIRVIHFALAWYLFGESKSACESSIRLLTQHLDRIAPTIHYAVGQDNNHGTSEAAALYIGGSWLQELTKNLQNPVLLKKAKRWERSGRKWLHDRVEKLIENDGGFSQYSVNYHRLMLDTLSVCEWWRKTWEYQPFSNAYYRKMELAGSWLFNFTDSENGLVPNLGHNDGANLFPLYNFDFSDFRSSVNFCYAVLKGEHVYEQVETHALLSILDLKTTGVKISSITRLYKDSGYALLKNEQASLLFNLPVFKFRPSQNDVFHVDLFVNHTNVLRDTGSFNYAANDEVWNLFSGVAGHNTVQFDDRQQMPRISRFLSAEWLSCQFDREISKKNDKQVFSASYSDAFGSKHSRALELSLNSVRVIDNLTGNFNKAVLRWHLCPGDWSIHDHEVLLESMSISISSNQNVKRFELINGLESKYYSRCTEIPVLEIEVEDSAIKESRDCEFVTQISWKGRKL